MHGSRTVAPAPSRRAAASCGTKRQMTGLRCWCETYPPTHRTRFPRSEFFGVKCSQPVRAARRRVEVGNKLDEKAIKVVLLVGRSITFDTQRRPVGVRVSPSSCQRLDLQGAPNTPSQRHRLNIGEQMQGEYCE